MVAVVKLFLDDQTRSCTGCDKELPFTKDHKNYRKRSEKAPWQFTTGAQSSICGEICFFGFGMLAEWQAEQQQRVRVPPAVDWTELQQAKFAAGQPIDSSGRRRVRLVAKHQQLGRIGATRRRRLVPPVCVRDSRRDVHVGERVKMRPCNQQEPGWPFPQE